VTIKSFAPAREGSDHSPTGGSGALHVEPAVDQPFTGELRPLNRIGTVQPETVAVLISPSKPLELRYPGDTLMPGWRPFRPPLQVLPVSTAKIPLRAVVTSLTTFDDHPIDEVTLRVTVQLAERGGFAVVLELFEQHGPALGAYLMEQLQTKIESSVRGAFRLNNLSVLRRRLAGILEERWLPPSFAGGALVRCGLSIAEVRWPSITDGFSPATTRASAPEPTINQFELSMDARLRRLWLSQCPVAVAGIAGAQVDGSATVVAACETAPDAYERERLRQGFADLFDDPTLVLAVTGAQDYADIVRGWLDQVDHRNVTLLGVDVVRSSDTLRIHLSRPLDVGQTTVRGRPGPTGSETEALRRLLPHRRVEIDALVGR
jgi:hypothetical protein